MSTEKMIKIPFNIERAKEIQEGKGPGRIVLREAECLSVEILKFDIKSSQPIVAAIHFTDCDKVYAYHNDGRTLYNHNCPKDLMIEVPTLTQCNDGDILMQVDCDCNCPFIFKELVDNRHIYYAGVDIENELIIAEKDEIWCSTNDEVRYATEEEKHRLIDALKESKDPLAKDYLKRFFNIKIKEEFKFQPFQQVLARNSEIDEWECSFFSHYYDSDDYRFYCINSLYSQCIPYNEKTKHLVGTTDNWEDE